MHPNCRAISLIFWLLALVTGACGQTPQTTLNVTLHDSYYNEHDSNRSEPPVWVVKSGQEITLNLDNQGHLAHNWAIVKRNEPVAHNKFDYSFEAQKIYFASPLLTAERQNSVTFTAPPEPGEYVVLCTELGHYPFMQGRLVVTD